MPATTQLEHFDVHKSYGHWYVMANHPAIRPLAQAKPNSEIFRLLAKAMGFIDPEFSVDDIELGRSIFNWDHPRLAHANYEQLLEKSWLHLNIDKSVNPFARGGFPSPSGRCEFFSAQLQAQGFDPLPDYLPPYEPPTEQYPLQMISPPARNFLNTTFVNVDSLRKTEPKQRLLMHPIDAAQRRLDDGAAIRMFNDRGHCDLVVHLSERTREGLVVAPSIWWHKLAEGGRNVNSLTSQRMTDLGEGPTFYDCAVQVTARAQCV
jgi:anaerobic selenocysteine-containing dehydrogenase